MDTLYSWNAYRAGAAITIAHSCGKVTGVAMIEPRNGKLIATRSAGSGGGEFALHMPK